MQCEETEAAMATFGAIETEQVIDWQCSMHRNSIWCQFEFLRLSASQVDNGNCHFGSCGCPAELIGPKPGQTEGNSESEVLVVKTTETFFIPQAAAIVE